MSFSLPNWIERWLDIESGPGEGTVWSLEHAWNWAPWVTLLFLAFTVVFVGTIYVRENSQASKTLRMGLAVVRVLLVMIVLFMLAQYALSLQRTGLPYLAILVDDSLSMTTVDRYDDRVAEKISRRVKAAGFPDLSRWNLARTLLVEREGALLEGIHKDYKLRVYFVTGARPSRSESVDQWLTEIRALEPAGESTRLGTAVRTVLADLRGSAPAAIVLLSDGINTDGPDLTDAAALARRKGVPLFTIGLGDDKPARDLELGDLFVDELVFAGDVVNFELKLTGSGFAGRQVQVVLRDRQKPGVLATIDVTVGPDGQPQRVRLPYRPTEVGKSRYVVEVEPLAGERETKNNRQERTVTVSDQKIRVLLVQGEPSYEFRFLTNMLSRDGSIELDYVLQSADPEHAEQSVSALRGFPVRRSELFQYDVIVLGDVDPDLLSASIIQNLVEFVEGSPEQERQGRGGALACIAGPKYMPLAYRDTPLARLLPITLSRVRDPASEQGGVEGFVLRPTEPGLASPQMQLGDTPAETRAIWESLAPLYWFLETPELKLGARVLAEHPLSRTPEGTPLPLISMQYVGAGKVLFHAVDETWRWRWRTGDVFFARYWVQTIRFLARSKLSEGEPSAVLTTDRREYQRGESAGLRVEFSGEGLAPAAQDGVTVVLEHQGHKTRRITLHRNAVNPKVFEALVRKPSVGSYHAWVALPTLEGPAPSVDFEVVAPPGEFKRVEMDAAEMRRAAEHTKGRFYSFPDADRLLNDLPAGRQVPIEALPAKPLWNTWPLLLGFLGLLITEWVLRKRGGMA